MNKEKSYSKDLNVENNINNLNKKEKNKQKNKLSKKGSNTKIIVAFILTALLLIITMVWASNVGGLKVSLFQLFKGIFLEHDETVAIIVELRFPRIVVAVLGGVAMSVSGVLMQAVMRNPLADPGIIGVSSGAAFVAVLITAYFPTLSGFTSLFSFIGGLVAFMVVYILSIKGSGSSVRLILVGIAVNALFTGLMTAFSQMTGSGFTNATSIVNANISLKTWSDAKILSIYLLVGMILTVLCIKKCNLLSLSDKTISSLGVSVGKTRFQVSLVSVILAASSTAIIGVVSFLGLIVPHISRLIVGSDHKKLLPFSAVLGALFFLVADTLGRWIAYPYEISASIIMSVVGGPMFIYLLIRSKKYA